MKLYYVSLLILLIGLVSTHKILPHPKKITLGQNKLTISNPCSIMFVVDFKQASDLFKITQVYFNQIFGAKRCPELGQQFRTIGGLYQQIEQPNELQVKINIQNMDRFYPLETKSEMYTLTINEQGETEIYALYYVGFLRALDTFAQLVFKKGADLFEFQELPITIEDEPVLAIRGLMIDTSRHFLKIETIQRTIDALLFMKLNILHWHMTDDESFPFLLEQYPEITRGGSYGIDEVYTATDVKAVIQYAADRGVQIIPEFDTPGHTWSWSKNDRFKDISITCGIQYGVFDPTMDLTWEAVESVFREIQDVFKNSPYVHFGGDEVITKCWDKRPSIKTFMALNGIATYDDLQTWYRRRQKELWRKVFGNQKDVLYWTDRQINLEVKEDDIIHWWGSTAELIDIKNKKNRIILSNAELLYLNTGMGNAFGNSLQLFVRWREIYEKLEFTIDGIAGTIIGGIATMWGETNDDNSHFTKLLVRLNVAAERFWNPNQKNKETLNAFFKRLYETEKRMIDLGYPVMPSSSEYCSRNPDVCFPIL